MKNITIIMSILLLTAFVPLLQADTVDDLLKSASDNYKAKKYMKALEDIGWAKQEISKQHMKLVKMQLPESIPGYQTRDIEGGTIFDMHSVSREYYNESQSIKIAIIGGKVGQGGSSLSSIMGMASTFQSMDANVESSMVMVQGRRGRFNLESSNSGTLTFNLENDVLLSIETKGFEDSSGAKLGADKLNFDDIENVFK